MVIGRKVEKVLDIVGEILAMLTIVLVVVMLANTKWEFIEGTLKTTLETIEMAMVVGVVGLKALEFALKRNIILFIICAAIIVVAFVFVFIPLF